MDHDLHWPQIARALRATPAHRLLDELRSGLGVEELLLFLTDYRRQGLTSLQPEPDPLHAAVADRCLDGAGVVDGDLVGVPLRHRGDPIGVITMRLPGADDRLLAALRDDLGPLLAMSLLTQFPIIDSLESCRRRERMSLPAEIQWGLLPPPSYVDDAVVVSAGVEPAYDTGGDVFDYARSGSLLRLAVVDAMGHGLRAAMLSGVAAAALRSARRDGAGIEDIADAIGAAVSSADPESFVTALLLDLDVSTGRYEWLSAGHPPPLAGFPSLLEPVRGEFNLPLGVSFGEVEPRRVQFGQLEPEQSLVLLSDGVVDNLVDGPDGQSVGEQRVQEIVGRHLQAGPNPGVARDIIDDVLHLTGTHLRDDATLMVAALVPPT